MHTVAPLVTALVSLGMAATALARDRRDRLVQEYAYLAGVVAFIFLCLFFLGLAERELLGFLPHWIWHYGVMLGGLLVAPASVQVYHRALRRYNPPGRSLIGILYGLAAIQAAACLLTSPTSQAFRVAAISTGVLIFSGLMVAMLVLLRVSRGIDDAEERARLRYLRWTSAVAVAANAAEMFIHVYNSFNEGRPDLPFPPLGALSAAVYIYFLGQVILAYRLLDLHEIIASMGVFLAVAVFLSAVYGVLVLWVGPAADPGGATSVLNTFLASVVVLVLYDPVRTLVERQVQDRFFADRFEIRRAVERLQRLLPGLIEREPLLRAILLALSDSRRAGLASIYLWDEAVAGYVPVEAVGTPPTPLLAAVPRDPFARALTERPGGCALDGARRLRDHAQGEERARWDVVCRTLDGMYADLSLPLVAGGAVLGWLNLRDARKPPGTGYRRDEVDALGAVVAQAAVLIDNTRQFQRMKDRDRLAALGEMAAGLAHEIRNPLGAIKGAAQILQAAPGLPADAEFLGIIVEETDRLNRVVSQFLDYSRPLAIERVPCTLEDVVRSVLQLAQAQGLPPGVDLRVLDGGPLRLVAADPEKLKQVVINLVQNAIEASPKGGEVRVATGSGGGRRGSLEPGPGTMVRKAGSLPAGTGAAFVELSVEDDGAGISGEDLSRLFIPFFTTKARGTGLGLPLCERVVIAHGGEIEVRTRPGRGSCFVVRLPALPP